MRRALAGTLLLFALAVPSARAAVTLQPVGSFTDPVFVTSEPNDPDHVLVVEQAGRIELSAGGVITPYLEISNMVASGGERGLLSVALAPDYATSGLLYVYYTRSGTAQELGDLQIDEYRASGESVSLATRRPVLTIEHSSADNHNGGQLEFGPDGYLYAGVGDGGGGGDPLGSGRNTGVLAKLLRIDPRAGAGTPYSIPADNPFAAGGGAAEVWSYGLRNPWRFSFDRLTGDLVIGDVGQGTWEEVDYEPAPGGGRGDNFGWNRCEGFNTYPPTSPATACPDGSLTPPVFQYAHTRGACSITGGYVVRDASLGDLYGRYLFADFCNSVISSMRLGLPAASDVRVEPFGVGQPSSFGEDSCGRVYVASLAADTVSRLVGSAPAACSAATPGPGAPPSPPPATCHGIDVTRAASSAGGRLEGTKDDDVITGSGGRDRIFGGHGDDVICAGRGDDVLGGGGGRDRLSGGPGEDRCTGGPGRDHQHSC